MGVMAALAGCSNDQPRIAEAPNGTSNARVLIIGMDGTRAEALDVASTPNLDNLRASGIADMHALTGDVSLSGPGWASMLTGVWCDKHQVIDNDVSWVQSQFDRYPHFFHRVQQAHPDWPTASISHWAAINDEILCADEADTDCAAPGHTVLNTETDAEVRDAAVDLLSRGDPRAVFLQFDDIDHAGHGDLPSGDLGGFCPFPGGDVSEGAENGLCLSIHYNPAYLDAIETTDGYIGDILGALYARPRFAAENWLILVAPDHGGGGVVFNQHGFPVAQDRRTFLIMAGSAVTELPAGQQTHIVDIAATALFHLGIALPDDGHMDGQPVGLTDAPAYIPRDIPTCYNPAIFVPDTGTGP